MVAAILAWAALAAQAAAAEPVFWPGARAGLVPPPGMIASEQFPGLQDGQRQASILVTELAAQSYERTLQQFSPDMFKLQGLEELVREEIALKQGRALLVAARAVTGSPATTRWTLVGLIEGVAVVLVGVIPDSAKGAYPDSAIRAAFASLIVRPRLPAGELLSLLPYSMGELSGFRVLRAGPDGAAMLTDGPKDTPLPIEQPFLLVALRGIAQMPQPSQREALARQALAAVSGLDRLTITRSEAIRIGTLPGHEILGETTDAKDGTPLTSVQWIMFGNGAYMQIYAISRAEIWPSVYPRLRAIRDGIRPK